MSCVHFDNLLDHLRGLQKEGKLSKRARHDMHILGVHIKFIRMLVRWAHNWTRRTAYKDWEASIETLVRAANLDLLSAEGKSSRSTVKQLLMNIDIHSRRIMHQCRYYMKIHQMVPFFGTNGGLVIDELITQLLDPLIYSMNNLLSHYYWRPLKAQILGIQRSLRFFRKCLALLASNLDLYMVGWPDHLLNFIEMLSENALFVCCICWFRGEEYLGTILADLLVKIRGYVPMVRDAYSRVLEVSTLEDRSAAGVDLQALAALGCLLRHDLENWELGDRNMLLVEELEFVENILTFTPKEYYTQLGRFNNQLAQIGCLADEVTSISNVEPKDKDISDRLNDVVTQLLNCINIMKADMRHSVTPKNSSWHFPRTLKLGFVDFVLQNLEIMLLDKADRLAPVKLEAETILSELLMLRSLLGDSSEQHKNVELRKIEEQVVNVSHKAEFLVDSLAVCTGPAWFFLLSLSEVVEEIKLLKMEATQICEAMINQAIEINEDKVQVDFNNSITTDEQDQMVGFDAESEKLRNRLQRGTKQLDIVSIVGMPGLGKTTLARKLYKSLTIASYFHLRSWCRVTQVYTRRGLLLDILADIVELNDAKVDSMSDDDLAELLCKSLKGRRHLVVLDDIWSVDAWNDLSICLPDQANRSRVLLTSRSEHVSLLAKPTSAPIKLGLLSDTESWLLLQKRVFKERSCSQELSVIGEKIAEYCRGLPLSVVVVAGILKDMDHTVQQWNGIAESVRKHTIDFDEEGKIIGLLELSYQHLPDHLKPCFLYFAMFPADTEITVQKLGWLWIAEGLVQKRNGRSLEDVVEVYLGDLISRSLVMISKRKSRGGIKSCFLHDLLLQFCLKRAKEENFLLLSPTDVSCSTYWNDLRIESHYSSKDEPQRECIHADREAMLRWRPYNNPHVRSVLYFTTAPERGSSKFPNDLSFLFFASNLLRVLDLAQFNLGRNFPVGLEFLAHLKYLALCGEMVAVRPSIQQLCNLETFILKGIRGEVSVPNDIWKLRRLRHLLIRDRACFEYPEDWEDSSFASVDVESVATPSLRFGEDSILEILAKLKCLRKLRCVFMESWDFSSGCNRFPELDFLGKLELLKVFYYGKVQYPCSELRFPVNLKKLTLSKFRLPWSHISKIGRLPNLEVLKLLFKSFEGDTWDVNNEEFTNLKFLKLEAIDVAQWDVSMCSDPFPCLEHLVVQRCKKLERIPSELGYVNTLQGIEVQFCSRAAAESAEAIQEEQLEMGNSDLQVHIHHLATDFGPIPKA